MILNLGLAKTGTTSLTKALRILGYKVKHDIFSIDEIDGYEAVTGGIAHNCDLDDIKAYYGDAKFILTTRNESDWLRSIDIQFHKHPNRRNKENVRKFYGTYKFDKITWLNRKRTYEAQVIRLFSPLVLEICNGDGWNMLCPYLEVVVPNVPFPCENKTKK